MRPTTNVSSSSTTVVHGNNDIMRSSNGYSLSVAGQAPQGNGSAGLSSSGGKRPYAHFDDLKQVKLDVTATTPVEKVLSYAESCLKQAGFMKDFGRLDIALQEYLKASIALLEVLPSNNDWLSVMTDRKGARVRYNALMAEVSADSAAYEKIKALIQEDNKRTGVQPQNSPAHGHSRSQSHNQNHLSPANSYANEANGCLSTDEPGFRGTDVSPPSHAPPLPPSTSPERPKPKPKPVIHPKPQALHGRTIRPGSSSSTSEAGGGSKTAQELAERFANLRTAKPLSPSPQLQQDPRIRTQPINHTSFPPQPPPHQPQPQQQQPPSHTQFQIRPLQHPSGFENLPAPPAPPPHNPPILHALPDLPKVPEAIYSPARGTVSSQSSQLPAPGPRTFNRTNSTNSFSGIGKTPAGQPPAEDYFSFQSTLERQQRQYPESAAPIRSRVTIPEGDTITAEELLSFMQAGSRDIQLLVIDIRSREEYDEGHIMSQSTICVDFEILQRENISANDIADSMVLAPTSETRLFDRRRDFDLIVYYDQDSEFIRPYHDSTSEADIAVASLYNALSFYDYEADEQTNRRPKLLKGGLDAWVSMMGTASLQTSSTSAGTGSGLSRAHANNRHRPNMLSRPHGRYMAKPIQDADEAKRWEESLKDMDKSAFVVRTTDDFLRRFPPVSAIQESMTSPPIAKDDSEVGFHPSGSSYLRSSVSQERPPSSRSTALTEPVSSARTSSSMPPPPYASLPAPPTRPAPTVPRPSHSDLGDVDEDDHYLRAKKAKAAVSSSSGHIRRQKVGLYNPGNWCYGNSSVQSLFASGAFSEELTTGAWGSRWKVPMKSDEKISHPQLLSKILANSFHWMQYGKFEAMKAKTLMDYCYHIHSKDYDGSTKTDRSTIFGGPYQQDAQEFISFLLDNLHDETNRLRDHTGEVQQPPLGPRSTPLSNGLKYWNEYRRCNDSIVDKYWRGIEVTDRRCRSCGHPSLTYEHFDALHLPIPPNASSSVTSLQDLLLQYCSADVLPEYKCDQCSRIDTTEKHVRLVRLPELLCISFRRFQGNEHYGFRKNNTAVVFPINGLDMTPYTVQQVDNGQEVEALGITDPQFRAPFVYDCYAVIVHSGTLKSGHYRAFVKDEPVDSGSISNGDGGNVDVSAAAPVPSTSLWHHFDDSRVEPVTIGTGDSRDMARRLYRDNNQASAYMVFYKRRRA